MQAQRDTFHYHSPAQFKAAKSFPRYDAGLVVYDAGMVATIAFLVVSFAAPAIGLRTFDLAGLIAASMLGRPVVAGMGDWWLALFVIVLTGTYALPTLYALTVFQFRPYFTRALGLAFGFAFWVITTLTFARSLSGGEAFTGLLSFLSYGFAFSGVARAHDS